jgi:hypothetical protein
MAYLVNFGYILMLCAFLARDVLWLRLLLTIAQTLVVIYAFQNGVPLIAAWNLLFASINGIWVLVILRDRRTVTIPPDLAGTYTRHFAALTPQEFLRIWNQGRREVVVGQPLARDGEHPESLYFLTAGTARVSRQGTPITDLPAGHFVAEMSLLTGQPANADVDALGEVEAVRWTVEELTAIRQRNPVLWTKIQSVIGHDIVRKLQSGSHVDRSDSVAPG